MIKLVLAAVVAFAFAGATPAYACDADCPMHKAKTASVDGEKVAAADKAEKKDGKVTCACADAKDCKCGAKCDCPTCHAGKKEKKDEQKKT